MIFDKEPEFRRPPARQTRPSSWLSFIEIFFGALAKMTMTMLGLIVVVFSIFGGGLIDLPTTRKEFKALLVILVVVGIGVVLAVHFNWFPM